MKRKKITRFMTEEEIKTHVIFGNFKDKVLWEKLDAIIMDEKLDFKLKVIACKKISDIVGNKESISDEIMVSQHVKDFSRYSVKRKNNMNKLFN